MPVCLPPDARLRKNAHRFGENAHRFLKNAHRFPSNPSPSESLFFVVVEPAATTVAYVATIEFVTNSAVCSYTTRTSQDVAIRVQLNDTHRRIDICLFHCFLHLSRDVVEMVAVKGGEAVEV